MKRQCDGFYIKLIIPFVVASIFAMNAHSREVELKVYQTSDVHGNYFPYDFINRQSTDGSLARVHAAVRQACEKNPDALLLLDNGDILQGQPTVYYYNYIDTVAPHIASEIMNYMGYDAGNVGNHDVETGHATLNRWARQCEMPILGANILDPETGTPLFTPYKVFERQGVKIAVLGMITPAIPAWLPEVLWQGMTFADMKATALRWIPEIQQCENPDIIIGLFHAGQDGNQLINYNENPSIEIAREIPGFDAVMIGHDHHRDLKTIVNVAGDSVIVINPANDANFLSELTFNLTVDDATGRVTRKSVSGDLVDLSRFKPDKDFMNRFFPQIKVIEEYVDEPLGVITDSITTRDAYFGPSKFVDLIHEMQLGLSGADISFVAPLSFDALIPAGTIRVNDLFKLYKYENMLYVMELSGREIKNYLEESYDRWVNTMRSADDHLLLFREEKFEGEPGRAALLNPSYNFDSAAGIRYIVDVTKPAGKKVKILSMADGSPFYYNKVYRVALNSYRGNGGGELLTDGAGIDHNRLSERIVYSTDRDMRFYLSHYIKRKGVIEPRSLNLWHFSPARLTNPATLRDRALLFPQ